MQPQIMRPELIAPACLIGGSLVASVVYYAAGDWRRGTYWLAAAVLNICVTI